MITGKTGSGFEFELRDDVLNNWEVLENLRSLDKGNVIAVVDLAPMLLGNEQMKALKEHLRKDDGVVPMDGMMAEIADIINASKEGKNS